MSDTFDTYISDPDSLPPLTKAVIAGMPQKLLGGGIVGPCVTDGSLRALLDALASLETRVTTLEG